MPLDVFASRVDALYQDPKTLLAGSFAATAAGTYVAVSDRSVALVVCIAAVALVNLVRFGCIFWYFHRRCDLKKRSEYAAWKRRYIVLAALHVALLCTLPTVVFAVTDDHASQLLSFSVAIGYLAGISGRNFACKELVIAQVAASAVPLSAAMIIGGGHYLAAIPLGLLPFFVGIVSIATRLRSLLSDLNASEQNSRHIATRFDAALNNMPIGLLMFDPNGRLLVANHRTHEILGTRLESGMNAQTAVASSRPSIKATRSDVSHLAALFAARMKRMPSGPLFTETLNDVALKIAFQAMNDGGTVVLVEDITEQRKAEHVIERLATFDSLTNLPNRAHFLREFERVLTNKVGETHALLFVDLDDFKRVNDTLGHAVGDELLRIVADRLRNVVGGGGFVSRLGGDEFVILLQSIGQLSEASAIASRTINIIDIPADISGHKLSVGASIGISIVPRDGKEAGEILQKADLALYSAKKKGRGKFVFFEAEMEVAAHARAALEADLKSALANEEFSLVFQPQYQLATGAITAFEALIRWRHPQRGWIPPATFIPVAEEIGLISEIGEWVLAQACAEARNWPDHIGIAVNVSPVQFDRSDVVGAVKRVLMNTGLTSTRLDLEITESALMQRGEHTTAILRYLREQGIKIVLDDFGTGYSSLSYLDQFPIDKLKIDRSFVQRIETDARSRVLLRGVTNMCADLGLRVVVEGVETTTQLQSIIEDTTVHEIQGYLFSRPLDPAQARVLIKAEPRQNVAQVRRNRVAAC